MAGAKRIVLAEIAKQNPKGSALKSVLDPKGFNEKISKVTGEEKQETPQNAGK